VFVLAGFFFGLFLFFVFPFSFFFIFQMHELFLKFVNFSQICKVFSNRRQNAQARAGSDVNGPNRRRNEQTRGRRLGSM
jgi:hypothetical protein